MLRKENKPARMFIFFKRSLRSESGKEERKDEEGWRGDILVPKGFSVIT